MATDLMYLNDFDVVTGDAVVTAIEETEDGRIDIQLDKTCFYPRGGGQDWDTGLITAADKGCFVVQEVRLDKNGVVHHKGTYQSGLANIGDEITCEVDAVRRLTNTRLHSAGHVIDLVVDNLKLPWVPARGGHYPHMSFVEYEGELEREMVETIQQQIEQMANEVIAKGSKNEIRFMPVSEMTNYCRHVPDNIPTNKPARVVIYSDSFGVPCGGTHVGDVREIGRMSISKIKAKKGLIKVSYRVDGIN